MKDKIKKLYLIGYEYFEENKYFILQTDLELININSLIHKITNLNLIKIDKIIMIELLTDNIVKKMKDELYFFDIVSDACKTLIYYNDYFKKWSIRYYTEPNYNILKDVSRNKKMKIYFIGSYMYSVYKTENTVSWLIQNLQLEHCIEKFDILIFNNKKNDDNDYNALIDTLSIFNEDDEIIFIINGDCNIFKLKILLLDIINEKENIYTYLFDGNNLHKVKINHNKIEISGNVCYG